MLRLCLAVVTIHLAGCAAPSPTLVPTCKHGNEASEKAVGYCRAVRVGNVLYISGVTGTAPMESAVPKVYEALKSILEANGLSFANVAKENVYTTDIDQFVKASEARKPFYGSNLPAATWVQVQRLFRPAQVLEVELIAYYPQ
jgi:2-iminobutanoate/2-iminopropanoate deaminase